MATLLQTLKKLGFKKLPKHPNVSSAYEYSSKEDGKQELYCNYIKEEGFNCIWIVGNSNLDSSGYPGGKALFTGKELEDYFNDYIK